MSAFRTSAVFSAVTLGVVLTCATFAFAVPDDGEVASADPITDPDSCIVTLNFPPIAGNAAWSLDVGKSCEPKIDESGKLNLNCKPADDVLPGICKVKYCSPSGKECYVSSEQTVPNESQIPRSLADLQNHFASNVAQGNVLSADNASRESEALAEAFRPLNDPRSPDLYKKDFWSEIGNYARPPLEPESQLSSFEANKNLKEIQTLLGLRQPQSADQVAPAPGASDASAGGVPESTFSGQGSVESTPATEATPREESDCAFFDLYCRAENIGSAIRESLLNDETGIALESNPFFRIPRILGQAISEGVSSQLPSWLSGDEAKVPESGTSQEETPTSVTPSAAPNPPAPAVTPPSTPAKEQTQEEVPPARALSFTERILQILGQRQPAPQETREEEERETPAPDPEERTPNPIVQPPPPPRTPGQLLRPPSAQPASQSRGGNQSGSGGFAGLLDRFGSLFEGEEDEEGEDKTPPTQPGTISPESPTPSVVTIIPNPASVAEGGTVSLSWSSVYTTVCTVFDESNREIVSDGAPDGTVKTPAITALTTFTVECQKLSGGTVSASTTVSVRQ